MATAAVVVILEEEELGTGGTKAMALSRAPAAPLTMVAPFLPALAWLVITIIYFITDAAVTSTVVSALSQRVRRDQGAMEWG